MRDAFDSFQRKQSSGFIFGILSRYLPEPHGQLFNKINEDLGEHIAIARSLLVDELDREGITEKQMYSRVQEGRPLSKSLQFAVSQVQEYSWYLTLVNHEWSFKLAEKDDSWAESSEDERQDFLHSNLLAAWELACRFDPEKGKFSSLLTLSQLHQAREIHLKGSDMTRFKYQKYVQPYRKAAEILRESKYANDPEMHELLASLLYDRRTKRVVFPEERIIRALEEYIAQVDPNKLDPSSFERPENLPRVIQWKHPYGPRMQKVISERIEHMRAILSIDKPLSLDSPHSVQTRNSITGELKTEETTLLQSEAGPDELNPTISRNELKQMINEKLILLSDREREVLEMRFGLKTGKEMTFEAIGSVLDLSEGEARWIKAKAIKKLRYPVRRDLKDYLK